MHEHAVAVITDAVQRASGDTVVSSTVVHGGDTSAAFRVETNDGRRFFAKTHPSPPAGFFTTEATSLAWLAESGAVHVPNVVAVSDGVDGRSGHLVLEWIEQGSHPPDEAAFGRSLAELHSAGAPHFGRADGRTTGISLGLPDDPTDNWDEFVATCRFTPLARIARDRGSLPTT
jgi:fructosamine-3-kinase